jgi:hypothetical protein
MSSMPDEGEWQVVDLQYDLVAEGRNRDLTFAPDVAPIPFETDLFTGQLGADGRLTAHPKVHFNDWSEAAAALEPFLRGWEMHHALEVGWPEIRFVYRSSHSTRPLGTPSQRVTAMSNVVGPIQGVPEARSAYSAPPGARYGRDPAADVLFARWESAIRGRENLTSAAYAALTFVEATFGGGSRDRAAQNIAISRNLLDLVARLAAQGDPLTARKITPGPQQRALTPGEAARLEAAFRLLALRAGELVAAGGSAASLRRLTVADLPPP